MNQPIQAKAFFQRGFSLVELMIAMALGLAVVAAVGTLSVNATRSYRAMNRTGEQIENGRYALNLIKSDLEHAGFYGLFNPIDANLVLPAYVPDTCATSGTLESFADSLLLHIPPQCSVTLYDRLSGTQSLKLLRAGTDQVTGTPTCGGNPPSCDTYIQANPAASIIGKVINPGMTHITHDKKSASGFVLLKPDGSPAAVRKLHVHVYYIRSYAKDRGDGIPTLMLKSPIDADDNAQSLIEGIENLQIQYGIDSSGDGSPDSYTDANDLSPSSPLDWSNIVAVRLNILARSADADPGYKDTKTYDLGGATPVSAKNDHYHRRVFTSVVRLINVSQRREQ